MDHQTPLQSSFILVSAAILSLVPSTVHQYLVLAVGCTSLAVYVAHRNRLSIRLGRLNNLAAETTETLVLARSQCVRDHADLIKWWGQLLQAKLSASKIKSRLLKLPSKTWRMYLEEIRAIMQDLDKCERQVHKIQTSALLAIEAQHQRNLAGDITESGVVTSAVEVVIESSGYGRLFNRSPGDLEENSE
ncbi:hypothetical protein B0H11DRAFT_1961215 [Mycena galericulata]|nr:hypothetical protein B0H11DRAFT_2052879 [Mycena galericulata]KAJ7509832.1 hypothetical protein B0H11DRAFT_1961215 [Mycena galericulata]